MLQARYRPNRRQNSFLCYNIERNKKGSILIVALWALCFLTTFAVYLGIGVSQKISLIERLDARDRLRYLAEAGVKAAILELETDKSLEEGCDTFNESWSDNPKIFKEIKVGEGNFTVSYIYFEGEEQKKRYGLKDEESKININKANKDTLKRLFHNVAGAEEDKAEEMAYCLIDWRDANSTLEHIRYGAEDDDYTSLSVPYEAKDADFEILDELLLIKGMDRGVFSKIKDWVTIYGEGKVNINTASPAVLEALGIDNKLANKIALYRKGEDLTDGTLDDNIFTNVTSAVAKLSQFYHLSPSEIENLSNSITAENFTAESYNFTVISSAKLNKKNEELKITAVINRQGEIRYWREEY